MARLDVHPTVKKPGKKPKREPPKPYGSEGLVSIVMPTVGRAEQAVEVVRQTVKTAGHHALEFVCPVDVEKETPGALVEVFLELEVPFVIVWQGEEYLLHARSWNRGLRHASGDYIVFFADDCWPEEGWLDEALRVMGTLPGGSGLVGFNDKRRKGHHEATHYIATRECVLEHLNGCIGFEHYQAHCNDSEACRRARKAGCYKWADKAVVVHMQKDDETRMRNHDRRKGAQDIKEMKRREKQGFPNDFEPAIVR